MKVDDKTEMRSSPSFNSDTEKQFWFDLNHLETKIRDKRTEILFYVTTLRQYSSLKDTPACKNNFHLFSKCN